MLWPRLDALDAAIAAQDVEAALALLAELVPEWQKDGGGTAPAGSNADLAEANDSGNPLTGVGG